MDEFAETLRRTMPFLFVIVASALQGEAAGAPGCVNGDREADRLIATQIRATDRHNHWKKEVERGKSSWNTISPIATTSVDV